MSENKGIKFNHDKPIENSNDDILSRDQFSEHLGSALLHWKKKESLVISICGEWGSGKTSIINLVKEWIREQSNHDNNKPTLIEFNPWRFSEEDSLSKIFFNEIAKELEITNDSENDKKIAKKLKLYASIFSFVPKENLLKNWKAIILFILGALGVTGSQFINQISWPAWITTVIPPTITLLYVVCEKLGVFYEKKSDYNSKTIFKVKEEVKDELTKREKKLVIVIDDIDRLTQSEIKQIFRLIRVNADFPNTIYLLAFDRKIVEENLEEQKGISGKDYLSKIVQVNFDIPLSNSSKISSILRSKLDEILSGLPEADKYYHQDENRWDYIYNQFKDFFKNIRDIKRFTNSLKFNISQMHQNEIMEVNPIDFTAIEAIRVFVPNFYSFMRNRKEIFMEPMIVTNKDQKETRDEIESAMNGLPDDIKNSLLELLKSLFPFINSLFQDKNFAILDYRNILSRENPTQGLLVYARKNFDSYFTMIPGGIEDELSQSEIEEILNKAFSTVEFEKALKELKSKKKITQYLQRIGDFMSDPIRVSRDNAQNIIEVLFNIYNDLDEERDNILDSEISIPIKRIILEIFKGGRGENFEMLMTTIQNSKSLSMPLKVISSLFDNKERRLNLRMYDLEVSENKIQELKKLFLEKIIKTNLDDLLKEKDLPAILIYWQRFDTEEKWTTLINEIKKDDQKLLLFLSTFIFKASRNILPHNIYKSWGEFHYKALSKFFNLKEIKIKLEKIKNQNPELYNQHHEVIDLYLKDFDEGIKELTSKQE